MPPPAAADTSQAGDRFMAAPNHPFKAERHVVRRAVPAACRNGWPGPRPVQFHSAADLAAKLPAPRTLL